MTTDRVPDHPRKEVTMTKRLVIVALVMAAALVLAAPAVAFDGYREGYIPSNGDNPTSCESCHRDGPEEFGIWNKWATTAHAMVGEATVTEDPPGTWELHGTANAEPIADGPGCAGCHASNYDPAKHVEDPVTEFYPWQNTAGDDAFSEPFVGCSACHWGKDPGQSLLGGTMHIVPQANMANADICGQCHSRYSASTVALPELRRLHLGAAVHHRHVQSAGLAVDDAGLDAAADHRLPQHPDADLTAVDGLLQGRGREPAAVERPRSRRGRGAVQRVGDGGSRGLARRTSTTHGPTPPSSRASSATPPTTVWPKRARSRPSPRPSTASPARPATTRTRPASRPRSGTRSAIRSSRPRAKSSASSATTARSRKARRPSRAARSITR